SAAPISFQWKRNGQAIADDGLVSGATSEQLVLGCVLDSDAADYNVEVSNFAGTRSSAKARLSMASPSGNLRVLEVCPDYVRLAVTGPPGYRFAIWTSTDLFGW